MFNKKNHHSFLSQNFNNLYQNHFFRGHINLLKQHLYKVKNKKIYIFSFNLIAKETEFQQHISDLAFLQGAHKFIGTTLYKIYKKIEE